jgi:integrase
MARTLTAVAVANARPGASRREIPDGGCRGLYLVVQTTGTRSWAIRYRFAGEPQKLTLGPALVEHRAEPDSAPELGTPLSLLAARELATKALRQAKSGINPAAEQQKGREAKLAAEADTLQSIAEEYLRREGPNLRSLNQRRADLALLCLKLGPLPVDQIRRGQYTRMLDHIADERGPARADRVLTALSRLLWWHAQRSDFVSPLTRGMRRLSAIDRARSRVLSDAELKAMWETAETFGPFGRYVQFILLTATRRNEAAAMRRSELLSADTWIIPATRYKSGRDMLMPLSAAAQAIVTAQPRLGDGDLIFSATGARPLGGFDRAKRAFEKASGVENWVIHDLRRTSRTLLSRAGVSADVAERCLGHVMGFVRGTYDRWDYEPEKRHAFTILAAQIDRIVHPQPKVADLAAERDKRR